MKTKRSMEESITNLENNQGRETVLADNAGSALQTPKVKKGLWIWAVLAACLGVAVIVAGVYIATMSGSGPVLMEDAHEEVVDDIENYTVLGSSLKRKQICTITFQDNLENQPEDAWDVSEKQNGAVMAWVIPAENDMYELYIAGEGGVQAPKSCAKLFRFYENVEEINFNGCFDTGHVTNMIAMFSLCTNLKQLDLGGFDTSHVKDMVAMFASCQNLEQLDLSNFDTGRVKFMAGMFANCTNLKQLDVSKFDTGHVTLMASMFENCPNLEQLDLSSFDMSKVTDDKDMFKDCPAKVTGL